MGVTESVIGWEGAGRGLVSRQGTPDWGPIKGRNKIRQFFGNMGCLDMTAVADTSYR